MFEFKDQFDLDDVFEGAVTIINWARTRRQRIILATSFDSQEYDVYDPAFSSEEDAPHRNDINNLIA